VFDDDPGFTRYRDWLLARTTPGEYEALRATVLNAHYTDPAYARAMWDALTGLGYAGGRAAELGCGPGTFIGLAPAGTHVTGVELDPLTAAIARALYPGADIIAGSFAEVRLPPGSFDVVTGNVPFADIKLDDPLHNPEQLLSMHDHAIVTALDDVRPGGMVAVLTSRYTMDGRNPQARRQIAGKADLVAAVRLPSGAHQRAAGTRTVTDLLILRRRPDGQPPAAGQEWEQSRPVALPGGETYVSQYFTARPDMVLGQMRAGRGQYGRDDNLDVRGSGDTAAALRAALAAAVREARDRGLVMTSPAAPVPAPRARTAGQDAPGGLMPGMIIARDDGTFTRVTGVFDDGTASGEPFPVPGTQAPELRHLLRLRDAIRALMDAEKNGTEDETARLRTALGRLYDSYLRAYGPVRRFTWGRPRPVPSARTRHAGDPVPDGGTGGPEEPGRVTPRIPPQQGGFRKDPWWHLVYALEGTYDPVSGTAPKADIFTRRANRRPQPLLGADTPGEALAICMAVHGKVRISEIARLLGVPGEKEARAELGQLVFDDPATGQPEWAPLYLSGDVRGKLAAAEAAAETDPRYQPNIGALRELLPRWLVPAEIEAQLGAGWIPARIVQDFIRDILGEDAAGPAAEQYLTAVHLGDAGHWDVTGGDRAATAAAVTWGTRRLCAQELLERCLKGTSEYIRLTRPDSNGDPVYDVRATEAAKQKARKIAARFREWAWEDEDRAQDLCRSYNARWNSRVPVSLDSIPLVFPGLSPLVRLRPNQPPAIGRIIYQGSAGLVHDTGAGKTLEMIVGARERKRLGLSNKPCFVVQRGKLGDFRDEYLRAYPDARLLVADTDDLRGDRRREFIARCATGSPEAVIISREAFTKIPVSAGLQVRYIQFEIGELRAALEKTDKKLRRTRKQIEKTIKKRAERLKSLLARIGRDKGLTYEDTGIDYLLVDEAQGYRRAPVVSSVPGESSPGSDRARDLTLKLLHHQERFGETRVCLASARPWVNRLCELYVWLRYLGEKTGPYDQWIRTFGKMVPGYEMTPTGDFRVRSRLREIINAPDLYLALRGKSDFKLQGHGLDLELPRLEGGKPQVEAVPATAAHADHAVRLKYRLDNLPGGPPEKGKDIYIAVLGDAIKAALDVRLVGLDTSEPQKAGVVARILYDKYLKHKDDEYLRADGTPDPRKGSLILVLCSLGVPDGSGGWNVYDEIRDQFTALGGPPDIFRYVQSARDTREREELFRDCRSGGMRILLGSNATAGEGLNVQDRAVGIIQVTPPWNWDEPDQELGRVLRPGNMNDEVFCIRVVTSRSCDALKWQRAKDKKDAFYQMMTGEITGRTIRVPDDLTDSELIAASSGDPRHLERARLEAAVRRLEFVRADWEQSRNALRYQARDDRRAADAARAAITALTAAIGKREDTRGDAFTMTIGDRAYRKRKEAAAALTALISRHADFAARNAMAGWDNWAAGAIGGFRLTLRINPGAVITKSVQLHMDGIPGLGNPAGANISDLAGGQPLTGLITQLENRLAGLEKARSDQDALIRQRQSRADEAEAEAEGGFPQETELGRLRTQLADLERDLFADAMPEAPGEHAAGGSETPEEPRGGPSAVTGRGIPSPRAPESPPPAPAAAPDGDSTEWIARHPELTVIGMVMETAAGDPAVAGMAAANDPARFYQWFIPWIQDTVAGLMPGSDEMPPFGRDFFGDPVFQAAVTVAAAGYAYRQHAGATPPDTFTSLAARAAASVIEASGGTSSCGCRPGPFPPGQDRPAADAAVRAGLELARYGIPPARRGVTWDSSAGTWAVCLHGADGKLTRRLVPDPAALAAAAAGSRPRSSPRPRGAILNRDPDAPVPRP
jgi:N12 class adenine-specific DNA methylase